MNWYLQDIEKLEAKPVVDNEKKKLVFYGSSSFTRWTSLEKDITEFNAVNMGFGGSTLAACTWFYQRVVPKHKPAGIILYAGDNDLGDGRTSEEVILFYYQLVHQIRQTLGNIPVCFVSIKPSPARFNLRAAIEYANKYIRESTEKSKNEHFIDVYSKMLDEKGGMKGELYDSDGLHLSAKGYELWHKEILHKCYQLFK